MSIQVEEVMLKGVNYLLSPIPLPFGPSEPAYRNQSRKEEGQGGNSTEL